MSFRILALIGAGFAIQSVLRLRSEETSNDAELVLSTPVSRSRWATGHLASAFGGSVVLLLVSGISVGVMAGLVLGDGEVVLRSVGASLAYVPATWVLVAATFALYAVAPRAAVAGWAVLIACFVIGMFGQLLELPAWVEDLSPFQHVPRLPAVDLAIGPLLVLVAVAVGLTFLGFGALRRRDIG
jgi:ABC-2 type transport system permease protein